MGSSTPVSSSQRRHRRDRARLPEREGDAGVVVAAWHQARVATVAREEDEQGRRLAAEFVTAGLGVGPTSRMPGRGRAQWFIARHGLIGSDPSRS